MNDSDGTVISSDTTEQPSFFRRIGAVLIDFLIVGGAHIVLSAIIYRMHVPFDYGAGIEGLIIPDVMMRVQYIELERLLDISEIILLLLLLPAFIAFHSWQSTPGKRLLNMYVHSGGKKPSFGQAFMRVFISMGIFQIIWLATIHLNHSSVIKFDQHMGSYYSVNIPSVKPLIQTHDGSLFMSLKATSDREAFQEAFDALDDEQRKKIQKDVEVINTGFYSSSIVSSLIPMALLGLIILIIVGPSLRKGHVRYLHDILLNTDIAVGKIKRSS